MNNNNSNPKDRRTEEKCVALRTRQIDSGNKGETNLPSYANSIEVFTQLKILSTLSTSNKAVSSTPAPLLQPSAIGPKLFTCTLVSEPS